MSLDAQLLAEAQVNHIYVIRLYPQARIVLRILDLLYWHSLDADRNRIPVKNKTYAKLR